MKYTNRLKGSVTQSLVKSLLTDAGITVVPLGIEEVIREVSALSLEKYLTLDLPSSLRELPDFFAVNSERTQSWLIEVKFRKTWNDVVRRELGEKLIKQVMSWSPIYLVLFFGETPSIHYPDTPASWVRAGRLTIENDDLHIQCSHNLKRWSDIVWNDLVRIQDVFPELNAPERWDAEVISSTLKISKGLVDLT